MIKFGTDEPVFKPKGLKFDDGQDKNIVLPKTCIGVFSKHLFKDIVEKFECKEVGKITCANLDKKVYILKYKGKEFTFYMAGVTAPFTVADIEELYAQGVRQIIIFGNCGVLDSTISDCSIIIPNLAYREEGSSFHYVQASETIELNPKYKEEFIELLEKLNFEYTIGPTWTTDAIYRETRDKVKYYQSLGVKTVEMEGSAIAAVCKYLNMDYFTFYYAGDNLDSVEWDERSMRELTNIDKKISD